MRVLLEERGEADGERSGRLRDAFTLVEIMIVVAIIGVLAAMAIPSFMKAREESQAKRFVNDMRIACDAFMQYSINTGGYPPDRTPAVIPPGMADYLTGMSWTRRTTIGGTWDWDYLQFGCTAGVSVYRPERTDSQMAAIDAMLDDGNLATGAFRKRTSGFIYMIEK